MRKYTVQKTTITSDDRPLQLYILRPKKHSVPSACVLWIHGGGYMTGMARMFSFSRAKDLAEMGAVVITPEYRLSHKSGYPAALNDCYAALLYAKKHARDLGADVNQIMVGGESAGGGLTVAVCMLARDKGEVNIAFQMPLYPMMDDRDTPSSKDNHAPVWNTRLNHMGWKAYLKDLYQTDRVPVYAAPARQTDYANLPPCYTFVTRGEPFYCETLTYIENLKKAGIPAKADVYPGQTHAFDMLMPFLKKSKIAVAAFKRQFRIAKKTYFARNTG